ncbi:MAG: type VI secretion system baseplate subunit TssE [Gemmataceae bacterium]
MSTLDPHQGLMPSILDRLIDPDSRGTAWRHGYGVDQMVEAVQRDLEELLNTRQSHMGLPEEFTEVLGSIVGYGLPDLTSLNALTPQQREEIGRVLEVVVGKFETRLRDIRATMLDPGDGKQRTVRFRIDARLCIDPAPEVSFETIMELTTGRYAVQQPGS